MPIIQTLAADLIAVNEHREWDIWLRGLEVSNPRFTDFLNSNQTKIRSKVRESRVSDERRHDLMTELHIPWLLLKRPEVFSITYEPEGRTRRGADYEVSSGAGSFRVEVTHLREDSTCRETGPDEEPVFEIPVEALIEKLAWKILGKIRQLSDSVPTVIWVDTRHCWIGPSYLPPAIRMIKSGIAQSEDWILRASNCTSVDEARAYFHNSSGIAVLSTWPDSHSRGNRYGFVANGNASIPLSNDAISLLSDMEVLDRVF